MSSRAQPSRARRGEDFSGELIELEGLLDLRDEGYGFLRTSGYLAGRNDAYVSASQVRRFGLRKGDYVKGAIRPPASSEKYPALVRVDLINGMTPEEARTRVRFEDLTPLFPDSRLRLELDDDPGEITGRIIDLISPIGKGQRGLIVSPPKAGKTTIIKQIVYSIERNNPETHVMVLLVDERPEEVTDMRRHVLRAEVVASTFDRPSDEHCHVAELAIERARRLVEMGKDVVIILDGITRLARAYNLAAPASGRIMSGGVDSSALYPPKKFFGSARNIEEGGSLTILATALDRHRLEDGRSASSRSSRAPATWSCASTGGSPTGASTPRSTSSSRAPATRSCCSTATTSSRSGSCAGCSNALEGGSGLELLIDKLRSTKTNAEFLNEIAKAPAGMARPDPQRCCRTGPVRACPLHWSHSCRPRSTPNTSRARSTARAATSSRPARPRPTLRVELCSECHPFYTGKQKLVDTGGRVERFQRRYAKKKPTAPKTA